MVTWLRRAGACLVVAALFGMAGAPATHAASQIRLTFFYPVGVAGSLAQLMTSFVDNFNHTHPAIRVAPTYAGNYSQTRLKVQAAILGGSPPDVVVLGAADLYTMLRLHAVLPLDRFVAQERKGWLGDFLPAFLLNSRADGHVWSIPWQRSTPIVFYNKALFRKAGLDPDHGPRTWDDLVADAQKLTVRNANGGVTQWGVEIPTSCLNCTYWLFQGFVQEAGSNLFALSGKHVDLTSSGAKAAMRFWHALAYTYHVMPQGVVKWETVPTDFLTGHVAIFYHSVGSLTFIREHATFPFGTAFLPAKKTYGVPTGGANFYILNGIPRSHQAAAWTFIDWMTQPVNAAKWSIGSGYIAIRKSAYEEPAMKTLVRQWPQYLVARNQLKYARAELMTYDNEKIYEIINTAAQQVMTGMLSPDAALEEAQKLADEALAPFQK